MQVFPKRSPLLADVSQAVLNVTGGEKIMNIENKWFKKESNCQDLTNPRVSSSRLDFKSFRVLFITTLVALALALIIYALHFTYKYRDVWNSETSTWRRIRALFKKFLEINPSRSSNQQPGVVTPPPNNSDPETLALGHTNTNSGEQQTSSTDRASPEVPPASSESATEVQEVQATSTPAETAH